MARRAWSSRGLSGRDPVILLPSLASLMDAMKSGYYCGVDAVPWREHKRRGLWGHVTMINALLVGRIRCKAGLEPFKKGWEYLDGKLSAVLDVRRIYGELVELGCLREKNGIVTPVPRATAALAMEETPATASGASVSHAGPSPASTTRCT